MFPSGKLYVLHVCWFLFLFPVKLQRPTLSVSPAASVITGTSVSLTCQRTDHDSVSVTFTFKKNGGLVNHGFATSNVYTIDPARLSDSGRYTCSVATASGVPSDASDELNLKGDLFIGYLSV